MNVMGMISTTHFRNDTRCPVACWIRPIPIRFGGVPTGVNRPPTEAEEVATSIRPAAYVRGARPRSPATIASSSDCAIGNIIAVTAVLLIHADSAAVGRPRNTKARVGWLGTAARDNTREAMG